MRGGGGHARLRGERQPHLTLPSYIQKSFARNWYYASKKHAIPLPLPGPSMQPTGFHLSLLSAPWHLKCHPALQRLPHLHHRRRRKRRLPRTDGRKPGPDQLPPCLSHEHLLPTGQPLLKLRPLDCRRTRLKPYDFNNAYGRMEAFGEDSVRLSLVDTAGIVIASLILPNSASSALPTVARRTTSSPIAISWDAAHENATVQLLSEVQTPASLLLTNLSAQIIAPHPLLGGRADQTLHIPMGHLHRGLYLVGMQAGTHGWTHHLIRP